MSFNFLGKPKAVPKTPEPPTTVNNKVTSKLMTTLKQTTTTKTTTTTINHFKIAPCSYSYDAITAGKFKFRKILNFKF